MDIDQLYQFDADVKRSGLNVKYTISPGNLITMRLYFDRGCSSPTWDVAIVKSYAQMVKVLDGWKAKYDAGAKTPMEVNRLKDNWLIDPCWDIEDTEGYEFHHDELLAYRLEIEAENKAAWQKVLMDKASKLGIEGNIKLAEYILQLERRLDALEANL